MRYLLDTNTISDFFQRQPGVMRRMTAVPPARLALSAVTVMEIEYGLVRRPAVRERVGQPWTALLAEIAVLPYGEHDARHTASVRAHLSTVGTPIGPFDLLLAGTALAHDLTLVTHNVAEFSRVPDLLVEDWWAD